MFHTLVGVIGYFTRTNNVVIGDKCRTVMFLVLMTLKNMDECMRTNVVIRDMRL